MSERTPTATELANHYVSKSLSGRKWYEITYWEGYTTTSIQSTQSLAQTGEKCV